MYKIILVRLILSLPLRHPCIILKSGVNLEHIYEGGGILNKFQPMSNKNGVNR